MIVSNRYLKMMKVKMLIQVSLGGIQVPIPVRVMRTRQGRGRIMMVRGVRGIRPGRRIGWRRRV